MFFQDAHKRKQETPKSKQNILETVTEILSSLQYPPFYINKGDMLILKQNIWFYITSHALLSLAIT